MCPTEKLFRRSSPGPPNRESPEAQLLPDPRAQRDENDRIYRILKIVEKVGIDKLDEMVEELENPEKSAGDISPLLRLGHFSEKNFTRKHKEECEKKQILEEEKNRRKELPGIDARKAAQMHRGKYNIIHYNISKTHMDESDPYGPPIIFLLNH